MRFRGPKLVLFCVAAILLCQAACRQAECAQDGRVGAFERAATGLAASIYRWRRANQTPPEQAGRGFQMRIMALFSGTSNDLGLDHRLGRQVLKLAVARARRLYPEMRHLELQVYSDESDCRSVNKIPIRVAEQFYSNNQAEEAAGFGGQGKRQTACPDFSANQTARDCDLTSRGSEAEPSGRLDAILGPSCDHLIDLMARMAAYWRTPIYTTTSISGSFARKQIYTTLTRLSPSIDQLSLFLLKVMERFRWRHLAIVVDTSQAENAQVLKNLEATIERQRYSIPIHRKVHPFSSFARNDTTTGSGEQQAPSNSTDRELAEGAESAATSGGGSGQSWRHCTREASDLFDEVRRSARVVLLLLNEPQVVRRLLLCAHELRLNNGEYTFLALNLGLKSSEGARRTGGKQIATAEEQAAGGAQARSSAQTLDWFRPDDEENNLKARQMFESLMILSAELPLGDEYGLFVEQTLDMTHQEFPDVRFGRSSVGPLAVALHDSLLLAVEAKRRQLERTAQLGDEKARNSNESEEEEDDDDDEEQGEVSERPRAEAPLMWNESFSGGLMAGLLINAQGDQELDYVLSDMEPELGVMRPVAGYAKESRQVLMLPNSYIHWPARLNAATGGLLHNDEPPLDEPECGFTGDAERCVDRQNLHTALVVAGLFQLVILVLAFVSLRRYRSIKYQMQLDDYWWKINWDELQFLQSDLHHQMSLNSKCASNLAPHLAQAADEKLSVHSGGSARSPHGSEVASKPVAGKRRPPAVPQLVAPSSVGGDERRAASVAGSQGGRSGLGAKSSLLDAASKMFRSELSFVVRNSSLALYHNELVVVKQLNGRSLEISRDLLVELKDIRELSNENLARLVGLCVEPERLAVVYEFCSRGNLQDLLLDESVSIDWNLKYSIIGDLINGLNFIHTTLLDCHGRLKSTNLVLDSRFTVKLIDFGLRNLYNQLEPIERRDIEEEEEDGDGEEHDDFDRQSEAAKSGRMSTVSRRRPQQRRPSGTQTIYNMDSVSVRGERLAGSSRLGSGSLLLAPTAGRMGAGRSERMRMKNRQSARLFWTAPEHLRARQPHLAASKRGDIYSLAIILCEIFTRKEPYYFGTTAKPRWQVIKRDKLRHQADQRAAAAGLDPLTAAAHSATGRSDSMQIGSHLGAGVRGARVSLASGATGAVSAASGAVQKAIRQNRRSQASVGPLPVQAEGSEPTEGAESSAASRGSAEKQRPVTISVSQCGPPGSQAPSVSDPSAIGEEPEEEEAAATGSVVSAGNRHQQRQSRVGSASNVSRDLTVTAPGSQARRGPLASSADELDADEVLDQLRMGVQPEPVRPYIPNYLLQEIDSRLMALLRNCWHEAPSSRPTAGQVRSSLRKITKGATAKNYLDNLLDRLQNYAGQLERIVDAKSADIMAEKRLTEELLYQLVPKFVADKLKRAEPIVPQLFDGVTIFFSDIVGFEKYASIMSPGELVDLLNNIYSSFDSIISSFDVTKIEVILDQFLVAAGISLAQHEAGAAGQPASDQAAVQQQEGASADKREEQGQAQAPQKQPKRGLLNKLRSQSSEDRTGRRQMTKQESLKQEQGGRAEPPAPQTAGAAIADLDQYKRSSAEQVARMALCIRDLVKSFSFRQALSGGQRQAEQAGGDEQTAGRKPDGGSFVAASFNIRIGIHSGRVCAGIVGAKRPKFCLIGDTVNVASRMHTNSKANRIQVSTDTRELLHQVPGFNLQPRGMIEVKGKGMMETFWLESSY